MCHAMNAFQVVSKFILYLAHNAISYPLENIYTISTKWQ